MTPDAENVQPHGRVGPGTKKKVRKYFPHLPVIKIGGFETGYALMILWLLVIAHDKGTTYNAAVLQQIRTTNRTAISIRRSLSTMRTTLVPTSFLHPGIPHLYLPLVVDIP